MNPTFKDICQKFDASTLQQLYKKITDEVTNNIVNKNIFPTTLVQGVFDGITGTRLDQVLTHYNFINIRYNGNRENTRLLIPTAYRRKYLIIAYGDYDGNYYIEQYKGSNLNDNDWQDSSNWITPFTEGRFILDVGEERLQDYINVYLDSKDLTSSISNKTGEIAKEYIESEAGTEIINNKTQDYLNDYITPELIQPWVEDVARELVPNVALEFFATDEGKDIIRDAIKPELEDLVGEYFDAFANYIQQNERVIANALARHEQAITDLQSNN